MKLSRRNPDPAAIAVPGGPVDEYPYQFAAHRLRHAHTSLAHSREFTQQQPEWAASSLGSRNLIPTHPLHAYERLADPRPASHSLFRQTTKEILSHQVDQSYSQLLQHSSTARSEVKTATKRTAANNASMKFAAAVYGCGRIYRSLFER